jgi:hypothetical protein
VRGELAAGRVAQLERERSVPNRRGIAHLGAGAARGCAAGHAATGLEELEGVGPEKARQLMQARVNQSCSQSWGETGLAFGLSTSRLLRGAGEKAHLPPIRCFEAFDWSHFRYSGAQQI